MRPAAVLMGVLLAVVALAAPPAAGQDAKAPPPAGRAVILGPTSFWRMHFALKPPVVDDGGKLVASLRKVAWLDEETAGPPVAWREPNFDDSLWLRTMPRGGCDTPYLARQCVRGKFVVTDAAQAKDLRLTVGYHGGAAVYLNGKELTRQHIPPGQIGEAALAEPYPLEAFVGPTGELLAVESTYITGGRTGKPDAETVRRMEARRRGIQDFAIPPGALRQGVNVLAIELVRAPFNKVLLDGEANSAPRSRGGKYDWCTCQLLDVSLTAAGPAGLVASVARPAGMQVWNSDAMSADSGLDFGDAAEPLGPIRLVGARNGSFSGKVVVGSSKALAGLKATASDLAGPGGTIPASAVTVRYGIAWGMEWGFSQNEGTIRMPYPQGQPYYGAVADAPPAETPLFKADRAAALSGAVTPVWITAGVPKDAKPGAYAGTLKIEAQGEKAVNVPIRLEVADFTIPDPQDHRTWVELIEVPDTLALEYNVPLWSDKHLAMIAESFRLISPTGTRVAYVPAVAHTNLGNAESMIRWIKKPAGGPSPYDWDFSVMDKYLDLAQKNLGTPKIVVLQVWELYFRSAMGKRFEDFKTVETPLVTMLDPASGKTENGSLPKLDDPASKAIWKGLIDAVRARLKSRGLEKALMLGMFTDATPSKEHLQFFHDIAPDLAWVQQGHGRWLEKVYGIADIGYQATVWGGYRFGDGLTQTNQKGPPTVQSLMGWRNPRLDCVFERNTDLDDYPSTRWRFFPETGVTSELRGIGRIGADYWKAVKNKEGRRAAWPHARFPEGAWGGSGIQLNLSSSALAPGPRGPVATNRLLALIEGVQECEARIAIERALCDESLKAKLGSDLAKRCQETLDRRLRDMWRTLSNLQLGGVYFFGATGWRWTPGIPGHRWYLSSGWQEQSRLLFDLAGQVQRATGT
jgi:hypothetical protein